MSRSILRQAVALSRQGKHAEALVQANLLPRTPRFAYQKALIQLEAEQAEAALETLQQIQEADSPVLHLYRSLTLAQLERWDEATVATERLKQLCPDHQFLPSLTCYLSLGQGQLDKALLALRVDDPPRLVSWFHPQLTGFSPLLSRLLLQVESYLLPLEFPHLYTDIALTEPVSIATPSPHLSLTALLHSVTGFIQQRLGLHYWEKGLTTKDAQKRHNYLERNLQAQRKAVQLEPLQFRGFYHLGEALLYSAVPWEAQLPDRARLLEAEKCFVHSWKQEGGNPYLYFYLGRTVQLLGQPLAAKTYFEHAIEQFKKFPEAHYALGQIHLLMGQPVQAREWFKESVSSDFMPVAQDRLQELSTAFKQGKLVPKPVMPLWPPLPPGDNGPTEEHSPPLENSAATNEVRAESHQCEDPASHPENHEKSPDLPGPTVADNLSNPASKAPD